jgi:hypothetical protein
MPKFPKPVPDKPFEPGDHRASRRVFPRPAKFTWSADSNVGVKRAFDLTIYDFWL